MTDEPLSAYNLTVNHNHTYFIAGKPNGKYQAFGVWVHNDCDKPKVTSLTTGSHASDRKLQGRNVGVAQNDLQRARRSDVFVQPDGRYIIRGKNGREHIIEPSDEIVTTINNRPNGVHLNKVKNEERRPITEQEYSFIKQYAGN